MPKDAKGPAENAMPAKDLPQPNYPYQQERSRERRTTTAYPAPAPDKMPAVKIEALKNLKA